MFIYKITNLITGQIYIGQTTKTVEKRFKEHVKRACYGHRKTYLYNAITKYGPENFNVKTIARANTQEELNYREGYYIKLFKSYTPLNYNIDLGPKERGYQSQETRDKIRAANLGRKQSPTSKEKNRVAHLGKKASQKSRLKMSLAYKGRRSIEVIDLTNEIFKFDSIRQAARVLKINEPSLRNHLSRKDNLLAKKYKARYV